MKSRVVKSVVKSSRVRQAVSAKVAPAGSERTFRLHYLIRNEAWFSFTIAAIAFALFAICEFAKSTLLGHFAIPVITSLAAAVHVHVTASSKISGYSLWQPGLGGMRFVTLQGMGWCLLCSSNFLAIVLWLNYSLVKREFELQGVIVATGLCTLLANGLLICSIGYFQRSATGTSDSEAEVEEARQGAVSSFHVMLAVTATLCFVLADLIIAQVLRIRPEHGILVLSAASLLTVITSSWTHVHAGRMLPSYKLWQPFQGGPAFALCQASGWTFFSIVMYISLSLLIGVAQDGTMALIYHHRRVAGILSALGVLQLVAQSSLMLSLRCFSPKQCEELQIFASSRLDSVTAWHGHLLWLFGAVLVVAPVALAFSVVLMSSWSKVCSTRVLEASMAILFLSGPISHLSGKMGDPSYHIWQPLAGGYRFIISQAIGWCLYTISLILLVLIHINGDNSTLLLGLHFVLPLAVAAQACISISVKFYDPEDCTHPVVEHPPPPPHCSVLLDISLAFVVPAAGVVLGALGMHVASQATTPTQEEVGCALLSTVAVANIAGFHLLWTHFWLMLSAGALLIRHEFLLGVATAMGFGLCLPWQFLLVIRRQLDAPGRALAGWGNFFGQLLGLGPQAFFGVEAMPSCFRLGFRLFDLSGHVFPMLVLFQHSGRHVTPAAVVLAYVLARLWSLSITLHHISIDFAELHRGRLRLLRHSQQRSAWVDRGVINQMYGFEPPMPPSVCHFVWCGEVICMASLLLVTLLEEQIKVQVLWTLGGGAMTDSWGLIHWAIRCTVLGIGSFWLGTIIVLAEKSLMSAALFVLLALLAGLGCFQILELKGGTMAIAQMLGLLF